VSRIGDPVYEPEEWMAQYLGALGGWAEVVRLLSGPRAVVQINAPLALAQQAMESMIGLLYRLREAGQLAEIPETI
jgi:hypothetical protein